MNPSTLDSKLQDTSAAIKMALGVESLPPTLVVLGSGFKGFEATLSAVRSVEFRELPHVVTPSVQGHGAALVIGRLGPTPVIVMTGRLHMYEGLSAHDVVYPLRTMARMGLKRVLLTNASGSLRSSLAPGSIVAVSDQINMTGTSCLGGAIGRHFGPQFLDMGSAFDRTWRAKILGLDNTIKEGIYAGVLGPAYETPAEARMLSHLGADVVGMSTVQEVMAAHQLGLKIACLSFVTNMSGGLGETLTHQDVLQLVATHQDRLKNLLAKAIGV